MTNMQIEKYLKQAIQAALVTLGFSVDEAVIHLEHPADLQHGDWATNVAMVIYKTHPDRSYQNPRQLATAIAETVTQTTTGEDNSPIERVEVAGGGFINFVLSNHFLLRAVTDVIDASSITVPQLHENLNVIIEFTDPNPFKEFHIGHLYSNTVGESIARLYEVTGAVVKRADYFGDVGMHVAKSVWGMRKKLANQQLSTETGLAQLATLPLNERVKFLGQAYALGATAYEEDEAAQQEMKEINFLTYLSGQENLQEMMEWEPQVDYHQFLEHTQFDYAEIKQIYQTGRAWSLEYFESIYARVGMRFDEYFPESIVGECGAKIVKEYLEKGVFERSEGAVIFPGKKYGLHDRVFINSLGLPTYEAKELGLAPEKYRRFPYDLSIIITGNEINEYFKVLLTALKLTYPELAAKTKHIGHGMVRLPEGKMSSRTGKILTGEWLMDEAQKRVDTILQQSRPEMTEKDRFAIAERVGLAAIKYAFLKANIGGDIAFSFDDSLAFQGNSGPYLLYTAVRCHSVLKKATELQSTIAESFDTLLNNKAYLSYEPNEDEKAILRNLYKYSEIVLTAAKEYSPHRICTYLYELSQLFNAFYGSNPILPKGETHMDLAHDGATIFRLALTQSVGNVLQHGLRLLGIQTVEQM